jgi:hypothetical protein
MGDEFRPYGGFRTPEERGPADNYGTPRSGPYTNPAPTRPVPGGAPYGQPPYGQPGYGQPGYGQPGYGRQPVAEQIEYGRPIPPYPDGPQTWATPEPPRRRGRITLALIATATAVVLTAGGVYAYSALSGGPGVLAAHAPGDTVAYLEVNLDPPAAQKIAAIRFLRKFPDARTGDEDGSLIDSVIEPLIDDQQTRTLFAENVKTWLGRHAALIGDPQDGDIQAVVLAETTDAEKTRAGLDRLNTQEPDEKDKIRYTITDGLVYLARTQRVADTAARGARDAALDANRTYSADVRAVGDSGIVTFWSDIAGAARYDPQDNGLGSEGRVAGSVTFTDTTADLTVKAFGNPTALGAQVVGPRVAKLPADTAVAVGLSGGDKLVRSVYDQVEQAGLGRRLEKAERESGLTLPDDVAALVGSGTVLAVGGTHDQPALGAVTTTDDPAGARRAAETLLRKAGGDVSLTVRSTADGTVLAGSAAYADRLVADGTLGEQDPFTAALPDIATATAVVYVDLRKAATVSGHPLSRQFRSVRAFGLTASSAGSDSTVHLRLVVG